MRRRVRMLLGRRQQRPAGGRCTAESCVREVSGGALPDQGSRGARGRGAAAAGRGRRCCSRCGRAGRTRTWPWCWWSRWSRWPRSGTGGRRAGRGVGGGLVRLLLHPALLTGSRSPSRPTSRPPCCCWWLAWPCPSLPPGPGGFRCWRSPTRATWPRFTRPSELAQTARSPDVVVEHVKDQLVNVLDLAGCRFEYGALLGHPPRLEQDGSVMVGRHRYDVEDGVSPPRRSNCGPSATASITADSCCGPSRRPGPRCRPAWSR